MNLLKLVDLTLLKSHASKEDLVKLAKEALKYEVAGICVHPQHVKLIKNNLPKKTSLKIVTVIGFPYGTQSLKIKELELKQAIKDGIDEADMVVNGFQVKEHQWGSILKEIKSLKKILKKKVLKVIIETSQLSNEEIIQISKICLKAKADYVKTSTGVNGEGAKVEHIKTIKEVVGTSAKIKASGGVRDLASFKALVEAGADRVGTSAINYLLNDKEVNREDY